MRKLAIIMKINTKAKFSDNIVNIVFKKQLKKQMNQYNFEYIKK